MRARGHGYAAPFLCAIALAVVAAPAPAQEPLSPDPRALARAMAAPWPDLQEGTGRLPDYMDEFQTESHEGTRYGDAMMGYGLVQTGLREGDMELVRTGLRAVAHATVERWLRESSFEAMAVAATYRLARSRVPNMPEFAENRARLESWMRSFRTTRIQVGNRFGNHWLVDALAVLELQRTGIRSRLKGTVLGSGRSAARRQAIDLINRGVPRLVRSKAEILSDPPDWPVAYHPFSGAMYARAMELIGSRASSAARRTLARVMRAAQLATAPDGDVAYWGRSQEEVFSLTSAAYAGAVAARVPGTSAGTAAMNRALARRALERVAANYPVGPRGQWFVPSLAQDLPAAARAQDGYVGAPSMGGLALVAVNWLLEDAPGELAPGRIPADGDLAAVLARGAGRFAVVRSGATWFAVKMQHAARWYARDDARYDFGLHVAKRLTGSGWTDLVPHRPLTSGRGVISSGPVLASGARAYPQGSSISVRPSGRVVVDGAFVTDRGRSPGRVVERARFDFRPAGCGVAMSFDARGGRRYEFDAYFAGQPAIDGAGASDGVQRFSVDPAPIALELQPGTFASGQHARLRRVRATISLPDTRRVTLTFCEA